MRQNDSDVATDSANKIWAHLKEFRNEPTGFAHLRNWVGDLRISLLTAHQDPLPVLSQDQSFFLAGKLH